MTWMIPAVASNGSSGPAFRFPVIPGLRMTPASPDEYPYMVVLENHTSRTIHAYTLRIEYMDSAGKTGGRNRQYFNFEPFSNGMEIGSGARRLIGLTMSIPLDVRRESSAYSSSAGGFSPEDHLEMLRTKASVTVSMDLIVFEDGEFGGPDEGATLAYLQAYLSAERATAVMIEQALARGDSRAEISARLDILSSEEHSSRPDRRGWLAEVHGRRCGIGRLRTLNSLEPKQFLAELRRIRAKPIIRFRPAAGTQTIPPP